MGFRRGSAARGGVDLKHRRAELACDPRVEVGDFAARHQRHQVRSTLAALWRRPRRFAILQHGVAVGDAPALLQEMADVDDAHALRRAGAR